MNLVDRIIAELAPARALRRAQSRAALQIVNARYDAATTGRRGSSWRPVWTDADTAASTRQRLANISRDMIRNTPLAVRAQQVIAANVIGDGIIPKFRAPTKTLQDQSLRLIERHLDTTAIDAQGRNNLYGLQRLALNTVIESGEVLIRRRRRQVSDGYELPLQIEVMEPDFLDATWDGTLSSGNTVREGIEYDQIGRRVAYYLYFQHPGASRYLNIRARQSSRRVPASEVLHIYRQDRAGQMRGVSWFAPVALNLQDLADHQDAQIMRQKIAACFAAFRITPDGTPVAEDTDSDIGRTLQPGAIRDLAPGEDIRFGQPPGVEGFEEFTRVVLRAVASGLGITYEALSGDLSNVNFSSARMGRMEMDRNVSAWQWLMIVPQLCQPLADWILDAWALQSGNPRVWDTRIAWVPPSRIIVDPSKEIPAVIRKIEAGLSSRQREVRGLGEDPERLNEEIVEDAQWARDNGIAFTSGQPAIEAEETGNGNEE